MDFEDTLVSLKSEKNNLLAKECLIEMEKGIVLFQPGFKKDAESLIKSYSGRLDMAKDLTRDNFNEDELLNWDVAIKNLENCSSEMLSFTMVSTVSKHFMIFNDSISRKLIGIFYLNNKHSIEAQEAHHLDIYSRGLTVSSMKYEKGQLTKEWK